MQTSSRSPWARLSLIGLRVVMWTAAAACPAACLVAFLAACNGGSGSAGGGGGSGGGSGGSAARALDSYGTPADLPELKRTEAFEAFAELGYRPEWVGYALMPSGRRVGEVAVYEDAVAIHNSGNSISVLEPTTGAVRWAVQLGSNLEKYVGTERNAAGDVLCCLQGEIQILDAKTGVLKERQRLAVIANTRPVVIGGIAVFGCPTGEVLGHNLVSGYKQWGHQLRGSINAAPVRVGQSVGAVSAGGEVAILDAARGVLVGQGRIFGGTDADPVASAQTLYIASLDQSLWAFDRYGGAPAWRQRTARPLRQAPTLFEGSVYAAIPGEGLVCFDASTGQRRWTLAGVSGSVIARRGERLIVWDGKVATTIDSVRGDAVARVELPDVARLITDRFVDGNMYAVSAKGQVSKFSPRT